MSGEVSKQVRDGNQPVGGLAWLAGPATGQHSGDAALLLALHPPNHLILWNMDTGAKVWKKSYGDALLGISLDPFTVGSALLRGQTSFLFIRDLHPSKCPKSEGKKFYVTSGSRGSPGREGEQVEIRPGKVRNRSMIRTTTILSFIGEKCWATANGEKHGSWCRGRPRGGEPACPHQRLSHRPIPHCSSQYGASCLLQVREGSKNLFTDFVHFQIILFQK